MRTPSWDEILEFLKFDRWREDRATGHDFFEKVLPDGEILLTHASRSGSKAISPGRFKSILTDQLKVNETQFWDVLQTRRPAIRPSRAPEPPPASLPLWLVRALAGEVGLSRDEIAGLAEVDGRARLNEARSRPRT